MKKVFRTIFLAAACFLLHNASYAQVDTAKASKLRLQLEDSICTYVSQIDTGTIKSEEDIQTAMMKPFMNGNATVLFMNYILASGVDVTNTSQTEELGTRLGMELMGTCPAFMNLALKVAASQMNDKTDKDDKKKDAAPDPGKSQDKRL